MKTILLTALIGILTSLNSVKAQEVKSDIQTQEIGWPKDVNGLVTHLNSWDKEELDLHERPETKPNQKAHGETNGWVIEHKEQLKSLGATVKWNPHLMRYQLVSANRK
jgi:hypothetical protein